MNGESNWFGQPRGLTILFLTNMWEQFSYFGMRALLVYYMTTTLLFDQEKSSSIYGFYTAFAYFTPIIGGTIADSLRVDPADAQWTAFLSQARATLDEAPSRFEITDARMQPVVATQAQTAAMLKAYRAQWAPVVQKSGYQP